MFWYFEKELGVSWWACSQFYDNPIRVRGVIRGKAIGEDGHQRGKADDEEGGKGRFSAG